MTTYNYIVDALHRAGLRVQLMNLFATAPPKRFVASPKRFVDEYDILSPTNERRGAAMVRRGEDGTRVFVEMDGDRLEAELARIAGPDRPEPPQDAAEHLARERLATGFKEATQDAAARTRERLATVVEEAAQDVLRNAKRGPDANEAAEAWLREGDPCPFDPAQRAWILRRIDRAVEAARLGAGADSVADVVWPEGGGEIDF